MTKLKFEVPNHSLLCAPVGGGLISATPAYSVPVSDVPDIETSAVSYLQMSLSDEYSTAVRCSCPATELLGLIEEAEKEHNPTGTCGYFDTDAQNYTVDSGARNQLTYWEKAWPGVLVFVTTLDE